jgi:hypothetical protein
MLMVTLKKIKASKSSLWAVLAVVLSWVFLAGEYGPKGNLYSYRAPDSAHWISCSDVDQYTGCFRYDLDLEAEARHAWLAVVSEGGFELLCNGNPIGAQGYWRPTRIFQNGLTESGQRVVRSEPIVAYNFPREYQWSGHDNTKLVTFFDLAPYLHKGKNSICLEAEGRTTQPTVLAFGEVITKDGTLVELVTNKNWVAEPVPRGLGRNSWAKPLYSVSHWSAAQVVAGKKRSFLSAVPEGTYEKPFSSHWIQPVRDAAGRFPGEVETQFSLQHPEGAYLRLASHGDFWLWVNDVRVEVSGSSKGLYNGGEWGVKWTGRRPLATPFVMLDPDEAEGFFVGKRFENPRHGDPTINDFKRYENTQNRTRDRPNQSGGNLEDDRSEEERGRLQDPYGFYEETDASLPQSLARPSASVQYHGYDIGAYLRDGQNSIRVKLVDREDFGYDGSQPLKFALDGIVRQSNTVDFSLEELTWKATGAASPMTAYKVKPSDLSVLDFYATNQPSANKWWEIALATGALTVLVIIGRSNRALTHWCLVYGCILGLIAMLAFSFAERSEYVWFLAESRGPLFVGLAAVVSFGVFCVGKKWQVSGRGRRSSTTIMVLLLILVFMLRAWMVHYQPIDDDEYASIQAVLAIAETGTPSLAGDIWYSRSPLYHYVAAGVVKVFGPNIWSLRLYSVVLSVVTGWVVWLLAMRFFKDRWVASASLLVFAFHPFLIFSGHIARFYQQQQLMVLLMVYLFIEGFIVRRGMWYRVGAILLFSFAVLSQEISVIFVPVFLITYLLFGRGVALKWDIKAVIYMAIAGVLIVADVLLFKVKCITDSVGVSPNIEATVAPTFWELGNLLSMFIGYSRLHVVLALFYFFSFVYSIRRGSKIVITLHVFLLVSICTFNFLITSVSFRYMYSIIPLWILLGVHGVSVFSRILASQTNRRVAMTMRWIVIGVVIASMSPWRIAGSYREKILGDPISSLAYVRGEMRESDKIMITEPHPHAAKIELGKVDYDLVVPILFDYTYRKDGVLHDRNGDARVVNRLADLQRIFVEDERVWIIINREKFRSRKKNIRWEYPGAREELFIRQNCELKYRSYLWSVYLWDQSLGKFETFRKEPGSWIE